MNKNKGWTIAYWAIAIVMLGVGAIGLYWRLVYGHLLANYGELIVWGLWVAMYIFFVGLSAGAFMVSSLFYAFGLERFRPVARLGLLVSLIAMPLGLVSIWFDLGHMWRFFELYTRPSFTSLMSVEVWLYTAFLIVLVWMIWLEYHDEEKKSKMLKVLSAIGLVLVVLYEGAGGALYGVAAARPAWHGGLFPLLFILSAFTAGVAGVIVAYVFFSKDHPDEEDYRRVVSELGKLLLALVAIESLFLFSEYSVALYSSVPSEIAPLIAILTGPYWYVFWIGQIGLGIVLPLIVLLWKRARQSPVWVGIAGVGVVIATFAMRLNIVIPPLALPELNGLIEAVPGSTRMSMQYMPSSMEWFLAIGIVGFGMALFALGYALFPTTPPAEKEA